MNVVITGIGLISALGNLHQTWKGLLAGQSGIRMHQPFSEFPAYPLALVESQPILELVPLIHLAVAAALEDAHLSAPLPECGVVVGSSRHHQGQLEVLARSFYTAQTLFSDRWLNVLPQVTAMTVASQIGTMGVVLSPMAACVTGLWAIAQGYELIQTGQCQRVLVGAVEAPVTPLALAGFQKMGVLATTGCYPFDQCREGLVLGESAVVLVLESDALAKKRSAEIYGQILGVGLTADGYHISSPDPQSHGAIAAIQHCLQRSSLSPERVDYIHAHGTGTQLNDATEANLIQNLFPAHVPVSSTKGATGHTLGASGTLGTAFCLMALRYQMLPPCVGFKILDCSLNLLLTATPSHVQNALCLGFGFGGQNAAIALARVDN
jgi:3-oxoacyl-[acyl-carrier-protein] synthase II